MRTIARNAVLTLLAASASAALPAAPDANLGGVIKVRIAVTSQVPGQPLDVRATVADGRFTSGDRDVRTRMLRGNDGQWVVVELTHTGRVTLESSRGEIRAVATYAAAPPGTQVRAAVWRRLQLAQVGTRIELQRAGSFVQVLPTDVSARVARSGAP